MRCNDTSAKVAGLCRLIAFFCFGLSVTSASAETVLDPGYITITDYSQGANAPYPSFGGPDAAIDNTDLVGDQHVIISLGTGTPGHPAPNTYNRQWGNGIFSEVPTNGINGGKEARLWAHFTFDRSYQLNQLKVWNVAGQDAWYSTLGTKYARFEYSNVDNPTSPSDWTNFFSDYLTQGTAIAGTTYGPTDIIDMGGVSAKHVAFSGITSYYNAASTYTSLAELQFVFTPEPMTIRVVPPINDTRILPTGPVNSGSVTNVLDVTACRGEYEPASFVITPINNINSLQVQAGNLQGPAGSISADAVDIKVVKPWYQSGSVGEAADKDYNLRTLVPALLLNDDSLVQVDHQSKENYLKTNYPNQGDYIWVSNPNEQPGDNPPLLSGAYPVMDSPTLLPVDIDANTNKQFWVTVQVPENAKPGNYSGPITLSTPTEQFDLTLNLEVLPFQLSKPCYTTFMYHRNPEGDQIPQRYREQMENLLAHGVEYPCYYPSPAAAALDDTFLQIRQDLGMTEGPVYLIGGGRRPSLEGRRMVGRI